MCSIEKYLKKENIILQLKAENKEDLIKKLCEKVEKNYAVSSGMLYEVILERESHGTTGIGNGVAIPHGRAEKLREIIIVLATLEDPVSYESIDGEDVKLVFMLLVPEGNNLVYLKLLSQVSIICNDKNTRTSLMNGDSADEILQIVRDFD
jgi:fructose-specific phosphotransferase system IIA component